MKKFALTTMSAVMLAGGLAACNTTGKNAMNERYDNNARPIGYHTNDDNGYNRRGWGFTNRDGVNNVNYHGGPVTDALDGDGRTGYDYNPQNYNRRGTTDNYSNVGYYNGTDEKLSRKIVDRVKKLNGVRDARAIVYGDQIIVGVDAADNHDKKVDKEVRASVRDIAQTRNLTVVTDDDMYERITKVDHNLRNVNTNGNGMNEVQSDINAILHDLGNAISRPFQNNR